MLRNGSRRSLIYSPPVVIAGGSSPTWTPGVAANIQLNSFAAGTVTFSINGGVNLPAGSVAVVFLGQDQVGSVPTSPQIGGVAMTLASTDSSDKCKIYYASLSGSTGDNFTFTNGGSYNAVGAVGGYLTGVTATPTATNINETYGNQANPQTTSASLTVPATGFGIVGLWSSTTGGGTPTWNVGVGDLDKSNAVTQQILLAHLTTSGTPSVTAGGATWAFAAGMAAAAWGP